MFETCMAAYPFNFKKNKNKITLPWMFPWEYSQNISDQLF